MSYREIPIASILKELPLEHSDPTVQRLSSSQAAYICLEGFLQTQS